MEETLRKMAESYLDIALKKNCWVQLPAADLTKESLEVFDGDFQNF